MKPYYETHSIFLNAEMNPLKVIGPCLAIVAMGFLILLSGL